MANPRPRFLQNAFYLMEAIPLWLLLSGLSALPIDWASAVGGWIGRTIGPRMGQTKKAARNLARAMPENSPEQNRRIIRGMWDNLGRVLAEYPHLQRICDRLEGGRIDIRGREIAEGLVSDGRPGLLFGAHLGNWELQALTARLVGLELGLIYRAPNNPWVDRLIRHYRGHAMLFPKGQQGARALIALLRGGGHAAMLVDQKMNDGIAVPFFGRDAMTAPALAQLAMRFDCVVVPVRTIRLRGARFRIEVFPPLSVPKSGNRAADEKTLMTRVNEIVEGWVREHPEQWLWLHRRWPN